MNLRFITIFCLLLLAGCAKQSGLYNGPNNIPVTKPGIRDPLTNGGLGPEMIAVAGGCYNMGSPATEQGRFANERLHAVCVDDFLIGKYEITFAEFDLFTKVTDGTKLDDNGLGRGERPAINVSWQDASAYLRWLSKQTGKKYRLPTEAEWEYAARAGSTSAYWWGDEFIIDNANCYGCMSNLKDTTHVGTFAPNAIGLHDISGNAWEWTCSVYSADYDGSETLCVSSSDKDAKRVMRGGSWLDFAFSVRSSSRGWNAPTVRFQTLGFRAVRTP